MGVNPNGRWLDIVRGVVGKRLSTSVGTADYDYTNLSIKFSENGGITDLKDTIGVNYELNHFVNLLGPFKVHIHWWQDSSDAFIFSYAYRIQKNGQAQTTSWTNGTYTVGDGGEAFTYSTGTLNQISTLIELDLESLGVNVSDTVQFKLTRSDNSGIGGTADVYFIDAHIQEDSNGSINEFTKYRSDL